MILTQPHLAVSVGPLHAVDYAGRSWLALRDDVPVLAGHAGRGVAHRR